MSGVTLSDLSKYHQGAMKWFKDGLVSEHNKLFAQTEEAGAVSFWPLGGTPLEGKVKFSFKETPPASGDKGPENPSAIAGVSSIAVGRCGRNLCPMEIGSNAMRPRGITVTLTSDGNGWHLSGTGSTSMTPYLYLMSDGNLGTWPEKLIRGKTYLFSVESNDANVSLQVYDSNSISSWGSPQEGKYVVHTMRSDGRSFILRVQVARGATVDTDAYVHVEEIDHLVPFEPYISNDYAIQLGSTYYGGEIDLATGLMTVTHVGFQPSRTYLQTSDVVVTGTQNLWQIFLGKINTRPANTFNYSESAGYGGPDFRCNYFQWDRTGNTKSFHTSGNFVYASFEGTTAEEAKQNCLSLYDTAIANNNPLTIVYPLATPYTVQLTPLQLTALTQKDKYTPRMNTVYTDADSIQIRYRKSLIHDEDEKVQAIVALGGNV